MGAGKHSMIEHRRHGCLTGCLIRILVLLGIASLLFVTACMTGILTNDAVTGEPVISFNNVRAPDLTGFQLDFSSIGTTVQEWTKKIPAIEWPYGVNAHGLTAKVLHAGDGECILICSDGYVMIADAGSGSGNWISGQMLLGGIKHINVLAALSSDDTNIGGMKTLVSRYKPGYLIYQDSQVKSSAYNAMMNAAEKINGLQVLSAAKGMNFQLGRAGVSVVGPVNTYHADSRDDGLSLRIDYGHTRILLLGTIGSDGGQDLSAPGRDVIADVLIAGNGGAALSAQLLSAVRPRYVLVAGKPDEAAISRARTWGASVYQMSENGVMSVYTDGTVLSFSK
ncbi:MAG: hypothetical protein IJ242_04675 [Clostridia bacterium]|nr:hypothetical protein [Clostridia bacterium]